MIMWYFQVQLLSVVWHDTNFDICDIWWGHCGARAHAMVFNVNRQKVRLQVRAMPSLSRVVVESLPVYWEHSEELCRRSVFEVSLTGLTGSHWVHTVTFNTVFNTHTHTHTDTCTHTGVFTFTMMSVGSSLQRKWFLIFSHDTINFIFHINFQDTLNVRAADVSWINRLFWCYWSLIFCLSHFLKSVSASLMWRFLFHLTELWPLDCRTKRRRHVGLYKTFLLQTKQRRK